MSSEYEPTDEFRVPEKGELYLYTDGITVGTCDETPFYHKFLGNRRIILRQIHQHVYRCECGEMS